MVKTDRHFSTSFYVLIEIHRRLTKLLVGMRNYSAFVLITSSSLKMECLCTNAYLYIPLKKMDGNDQGCGVDTILATSNPTSSTKNPLRLRLHTAPAPTPTHTRPQTAHRACNCYGAH